MADVKIKYPSADSIALTCTCTNLPTNAQGVYLAGRASTAVDNTTTQDLDHLFSGTITYSAISAPAAGRSVNIYAYAPIGNFGATWTYPDSITGTDAAKTMTSANVMNSGLRFVASVTMDVVTYRIYTIAPVSIASLFGGVLPKKWGIFLAHDTGFDLNGANLYYERIQSQTV